MFPELDKLVQDKRLKEWSIAVCSLEEVFLRVASGWTGSEDEQHDEKTAVKLPETRRGVVKNGLQILALFKRRAQYMKRSWLYLVMQTLAPALNILIFFAFISAIFSSVFSSPARLRAQTGSSKVQPNQVRRTPQTKIPRPLGNEHGQTFFSRMNLQIVM